MYFFNPNIDSMIRLTDVIVFDLNGLLVDDELIQLQATNEVLSAYGIALSEKTWIEECVGKKPNEYLPRMLAHMAHVNIAQIVREKYVIYDLHVSENVHKIMPMARYHFLNMLVNQRSY
jgi:beta-phosphoglucomutase-like phosphatase (HAD superfamily)